MYSSLGLKMSVLPRQLTLNCGFSIKPCQWNKEPHFEWPDLGIPGVIGPHGIGQTGYHPIPVEKMIELWERKTEIYLATRVEYRDVFDPSIIHHHEQCAILDLIRHPADVETDTRNIPRVTMRTYGPHNAVA
jgi:hypothetical protein